MRKLYLHIGNHKTGSTTIQAALARADDPRIFNEKLNERRFSGYVEWYGNAWIRYRKSEEFIKRAYLHESLAELLVAFNPEGDVIFSSEDMSWIMDPEEIEKFAQALKPHFDEIRVIVYLRRQDRAAVSFVQQASKMGGGISKDFFGLVEGALPEYSPKLDEYFDYDLRIGKWADAFGDDAMKFAIFNDIVNHDALVQSFGAMVGLKLEKGELHKRKSIPKAWQILNQRLHNMEASTKIPRELCELMIEGEKMSPSRAHAMAFYENFRAANIRLNERFRINAREAVFDEDFEQYSEAGNEDLDPEAARQVIDTLILALMRSDAQRIESDKRRRYLRRKIKKLEGDENKLELKDEPE